MSRVKTFDSTGVAPNGVFYAGDANAIQDKYADLSGNFTQTLDLGTLRLAESGLQILRYATSPLEARVTAAFRADGILRGLSGIFAGTYTTAQRDAIAAGSRPYGLVLLNSTTNQLEINLGTDAAPAWAAVGATAMPVGTVLPYSGGEGNVPAGFGLCDGAEISRTTYATLNSLYSAQGYPFGTGNGSTTFNKPDFRGRGPIGRDNMGGTVANRVPGANSMGASGGTYQETLDISKVPSHSHGGLSGSASPATGTESADHTHTYSGTTSGESQDHTHGVNITSAVNAGSVAFLLNNFAGGGVQVGTSSGVFTGVSTFNHAHNVVGNTGGRSAGHTHTFSGTSAGKSATHTHTVNSHNHTISAEGGGNPHNNMQPYLAVNYIVKLT